MQLVGRRPLRTQMTSFCWSFSKIRVFVQSLDRVLICLNHSTLAYTCHLRSKNDRRDRKKLVNKNKSSKSKYFSFIVILNELGTLFPGNDAKNLIALFQTRCITTSAWIVASNKVDYESEYRSTENKMLIFNYYD